MSTPTDFVQEGNKQRIVRFHGEPWETEALILRLAIAVAWRARLGYATSGDQLAILRRHLLRRDLLYSTYYELETVLQLAEHYSADHQTQLREWGGLRLPLFPAESATAARPLLDTKIFYENWTQARLGLVIDDVAALNTVIAAYNQSFDEDDIQGTRARQVETRDTIRQMPELTHLKEWAATAFHDVAYVAERRYPLTQITDSEYTTSK